MHEQVCARKRKSSRITALTGIPYKEMVKTSQKDLAAADKNKKLKFSLKKKKLLLVQLALLTAALFVGKQLKRTKFNVDIVKSGYIRLVQI